MIKALKVVAVAIIATADMHEGSWNAETKSYSVSIPKAADIVCNQMDETGHLTMPVYFLLSTAWNDALDWAKQTVEY